VSFSNFNWIAGLFIIGYHLLLLVALPIYFINHSPSWQILTTASVMLYLTGLAITTGYHRLYAHTTYKTNKAFEAVLLFFGTLATQGSVLRWAYDHRHHHAFVDTEKDPYSIKKGFWYAHFLWIFEKPKEIEERVVADLVRNPLLRFQHRYYGLLMFATNLLTTLFFGWLFNDYLSAFLFVWLVRLFFLHHFTWFINSLAHTWGSQTFCQEHSAVDNYIISLLTFGEGYHNYHHTFAYDYRNGVRWYHYDPAKWLLWTMGKLGIAYKLKRAPSYMIQEKILLDRKQLLLERIQSSIDSCKGEWEEKITKLSESVLSKLKEVQKLTEQYHGLKKNKEAGKEYLKELNAQIKKVKKSLSEEYRNWTHLSHHIAALPANA
jgi:stearoyl-CoA desaturase (delta-9 desaturase)